ncbi:hypothetical protein [Lysinibacillus sp. 3P01SB]|uniref:hypothetical protein n=1 Tax=Lysinibacillus sp. 3P01SB TaxID=3132284 RepID=UPI0039A419F8
MVALERSRSKGNKSYLEENNQTVVKDYLSGNYKMLEALSNYRISDLLVFKKWLKLYTRHNELEDSGKGMDRLK